MFSQNKKRSRRRRRSKLRKKMCLRKKVIRKIYKKKVSLKIKDQKNDLYPIYIFNPSTRKLLIILVRIENMAISYQNIFNKFSIQ